MAGNSAHSRLFSRLDPTDNRVGRTIVNKLKPPEAELLSREAQLRDFSPLRDRLVASSQDANATYRKIQSQPNELAAQLGEAHAGSGPSSCDRRRRHASTHFVALSSHCSNASDHRLGTMIWHSGNGPDRARSGRHQRDSTWQDCELGAIAATGRFRNRVITFGDVLEVSFQSDSQNFDPNDAYVWRRNSNYLCFFPPPTQLSTLTCSFEVEALPSHSGARAQ